MVSFRTRMFVPTVLLGLRLMMAIAPLVESVQNLDFHEEFFLDQVENSLFSLKTILDTTRDPILAEQAEHTYEDKYALTEFVTISAISSYLVAFERLGIDVATLQKTYGILDWVHNQHRSVVLRIQIATTCSFDKEQEKKITTAESEVETTSSSGIMRHIASETETIKVKRTVKEFHWTVELSTNVTLISGEDSVKLRGTKTKSTSIIQYRDQDHSTSSRPRAPLESVMQTIDLDLTWLLQMVDPPMTNNEEQAYEPTLSFAIDRTAETCKTPSRNAEIERAIAFQKELFMWTEKVDALFVSTQDKLRQFTTTDASLTNGPSIAMPDSHGVFNPIVPLFENSTILSKADLDRFIAHQKHTLDGAMASLAKRFSVEGMISYDEAVFVLLSLHMGDLAGQYEASVAYVEKLLKDQLIQAIGKEFGPEDFEQYMRFHNQKFFATPFSPTPFSYAVRRENHYPDGMLSIEATNDVNDKKEPIETLARKFPGGSNPPMYIPINAATKVEIRGDRFLHGWMQHIWANYNPTSRPHLIARAHQFSSFLVVVGVVGGPDTFLPKEAIVVQNKDEIIIPLEMTMLPSAREFKDAIASLSPEQRSFAQAFRSMQLESSVFGVCVIQLKPQLERLLDLPSGALTKEIQLTQDLMSLFVEYQIPSDLLSFDGSIDASVEEKVTAVAGHVQAVLDVIDKALLKDMEEEKRKADVRKMRANPRYMEKDTADGPAIGSYAAVADEMMYKSSSTASRGRTGPHTYPSSTASSVPISPKTGGPATSESTSQEFPRSRRLLNQEGGDSTSSSETTGRAKAPDRSSRPATSGHDFTFIPKVLDAQLEQYDKDGALSSTIITAAKPWNRRRQDNILVPTVMSRLSESEIESEQNKAMDLLTAISRSGALPIDDSELHVIVAVAHSFEKNIMSTIIEDSVNPIDKVEASMVLVASTIYNETQSVLLAAKDTGSLLESAGKEG